MSKKTSPDGRPLSVHEILHAIRSLPGPEKVALFTALWENPEDMGPYRVMPMEWIGELLLGPAGEKLKGRPPTMTEKYKDLLTLYEADKIQNSIKILAKKYRLNAVNLRKAFSRLRKERAKEKEQQQNFGRITATWET